MSTGLMAILGVLALVGLFGLILLWDRKKTDREEAGPKRAVEDHMTPTERWDAHVEQLQKRGS